MEFAEREKKSLNKNFGGPQKKSINKYPEFFTNIFPLDDMGQKQHKMLRFLTQNCARFCGGRLPHQIASDFDDFCAILKLSVSAFWKPKFY